MSYAYPGRARPRARACARCSRPTPRPAGATPACCSTPRTAARRSRASRAAAAGLPARVIPVEVHHVASVGLDVWLARARVRRERRSPCSRPAPRRRSTARRSSGRCAIADTIAQALGYQGEHFRVRRRRRRRGARRGALVVAAGARRCASPATFALTGDKRTTAALAIEHLARARAGAAARDRAARRRAVRHDRRRPRRLHDVPRLRRRVSRRRDPRQPGGAAASLHRDRNACSAACARRPAPRTRSRSSPRLVLAPEARQPRVLNEASIVQLHRAAASRSAPRR